MTEGERRVLDIILVTLERMGGKLDSIAVNLSALQQSHEDMCRRVVKSETELAVIEDMIHSQGRDLDKHNKLWVEHLASHARLEAPVRYVITAVLTALALLVFYWILGGGMMPLLSVAIRGLRFMSTAIGGLLCWTSSLRVFLLRW